MALINQYFHLILYGKIIKNKQLLGIVSMVYEYKEIGTIPDSRQST